MGLEFIITTKEEVAPRAVAFEELFPQKENITSLALLWDTNCYYVNVSKRYFIVNGGRRLYMREAFKDCKGVEVLYRKRHREQLSVGGNGQDSNKVHEVSYILGLTGALSDGECKELMLHISPDGKDWYWREHR